MEYLIRDNERRYKKEKMISKKNTAILLSCIFCLSVFLGIGYAEDSAGGNPQGSIGDYTDDKSSLELELLDFANGLFQRGFRKMAISEYRKFIEQYPQSGYLGDAYFGIAESIFFDGQYSDALEEYRRYLEVFPNGAKAEISGMRVGQSLFNMEKYDDALEYFTKVDHKKLDDTFKQVLNFYTAAAYKTKGDMQNALEYFKRTAGQGQDKDYKVQALLAIGDIHMSKAEYDMAVQAYDNAYANAASREIKSYAAYKKAETGFLSGNYLVSAVEFKNVVEEYPEQDVFVNALSNLFLSLFNIDEYGDIISEFKDKKGMIGDKKVFFDVYYITALAYFESGGYEEALGVLDEILESRELDEDLLHKVNVKKAEVFFGLKRFQDVVELSNSTLLKDNGDKDYLLFMKAEAEYALGNFEEARKLYEDIIRDFPDSEFADDVLYGLAYSQKSIGADDTAEKVFIQYFNDGKDPAKRQEALYNALLIKVKIGPAEKAIEYSKTFLSTFKESALNEKILFRLGLLYSSLKDYDSAINTFRQYIGEYDQSERLQNAYFELAYNLQLMEKLDESLAAYRKIVPDRDDRLFYSALRNIGLIHVRKGDNKSAARVYDRIIMETKGEDIAIDTYLWLARFYLDEKRFTDVLRIVHKAGQVEASEGHIKEMAYFKAEAYRETSQFGIAVKNYDIVLSEQGDDIFSGAAHIGKGVCLSGLGEYEIALAELETALLENPEDNTITMRARFEIANLENEKGNLEEAGKLYMLVAILYNDGYYCPEALFRAGKVFETLKRSDDAKRVYLEIVKKYGESHLSEDADEKLKVLNES